MNKAVDTLSSLLQSLPQSKKQEVSGTEVMKLFSCSTQLSMKFIMLINVKMPIDGILTFTSRMNGWLW